MVNDAWRFSRSSQSVIEEAPLQIYASALMFAPKNSIIRRVFEKEIPCSVQVVSSMEENWGSLLQFLEGHTSCVISVIFSPDGSQLGSASNN